MTAQTSLRPRLTANVVRALIFKEPEEDGVAQERLVGPAEIGDLRDKLGPNPMHLRQRKRAAKAAPARRRRGQRFQALVEHRQRLDGPAVQT